MHIKPKDPRSFVTPAPGAYNPESADRDVKPMAPRYSFGIKGKDEKPISIPGEKKKNRKTTDMVNAKNISLKKYSMRLKETF